MKKYLFLFTIGPVQSFIAQARKTQDLYAGSKLLSDLVRYAIETFNKETNTANNIRFPEKWNNKDAALPNRFLAEIEIEPDNAKTFGEKIEKAVNDKFIDIANSVFIKNAGNQNKPVGFDFQIENHLSINWLFEDLSDKTYYQAFQNIENNLGAIKNIRKFKQLPETEVGRKDSLSGELNALFFNDKFNKPDFSEKAIMINSSSVLLSKGEGLSAVSFVKRFYLDKSFPSTAEIAQYDLKKNLENDQNFQTYKNFFKENFDYQLLYKENLTEKYFEKHDLKVNKGGLEFVKELYKKIEFPKDKKQKKYYAILIFDGDDMGKWLSGDLLKDDKNNDETLIKYHERLSELLAEFADKAKKYIDVNKLGRTVYAGGDDFLALLNLDKIFETLSHLRTLFDIDVNQKIKTEFNQISKSENLTFSAGLTIAHYKEPLGEVLNRARSMEQKAKQVDDKNALAIAVMKHSGEMQESIFKWGNQTNVVQNIEYISEILKLLDNKDFSTAFINNLYREFSYFIDNKTDNPKDIAKYFEMIQVEIERLIIRAKSKNISKQEAKEYSKFAKKLYQSISNYEKPLFNFLEILKIIDFINRKS